MSPDVAVERVLAALAALLYFAELGAANHGQVVEACLKHAGANPGDPWCAALQSYAGHRGLLTIDPVSLARTSAWPLRASAGCQDLFEQATAKGIVHTTPERGDLVVVWYASHNRFAHIGMCLAPSSNARWLTYEGNTIGDPEDPAHLKPAAGQGQDPREGWASFPKRRTFKPEDRFLRWKSLIT
jgi:hypothetical protein